MSAAGWHADPWRRAQHRYFDGQQWTAHISDNGVAAGDPDALSMPLPADMPPATLTPAMPAKAPPLAAPLPSPSVEPAAFPSSWSSPTAEPSKRWTRKTKWAAGGVAAFLAIGAIGVAASGPKKAPAPTIPTTVAVPATTTTTGATTVATTVPATTTTDAATTTAAPTTTPPPTEAPTVATTVPTTPAPQTSLQPVVQTPATTRATSAPAPATTPAPAPSGAVRAGSFCSTEGATGHTSTGTPMVCATASDGRLRWRSA